MYKKIISILLSLLLFTYTCLIFINSTVVIETVTFSINLFVTKLLPALFPFFILGDLLKAYGIIDLLGGLFSNVMGKLFHLKGECAFVLAMSMISGFPSGAKYTKDLLDSQIINEKEATHLLTFTHFSSPLFIIEVIGIGLLNNKKIGLVILIIHYLTNIIIGIIIRNKKKIDLVKSSLYNSLKLMHNKRISNNQSFVVILTNSIFKTFKTLILMLGIITFFLIISTIIKTTLPLSSFTSAFISGILEMTGGLYSISNISLPTCYKAALMTAFISFGGLSVHMQIYSLIKDTNIKYFPFLIARIAHALIAAILVFLYLTATM
ncbi:MAG: hypothetical protein RR406_04445 [Bacilli bacterium]